MASEEQRDLEAALEEGQDEFNAEPKPGTQRVVPRLGRAPSILSNISNHSFASPSDMIRRLAVHSRRATNVSHTHVTETPREFIAFLSERQTHQTSTALTDACDWFARFIEIKYRASWSTLILPNVVFSREREGFERPTSTSSGRLPTIPEPEATQVSTVIPNRDSIAVVDHVLTLLARKMQTETDFTLSGVADDLVNDDLVKDDAEHERAALHKLVFTFSGWLSMLYEPDVESTSDDFRLDESSAFTTSGEKVSTKTRTINNYAQSAEEIDNSFFQLLSRFGTLIPAAQPRKSADVTPPAEWILAPYVCYHTLRKVCRIEIEWVETLGMHLEFDSSRKRLKVFRFPSFCRLMYRHGEKGLLSRIFDDNARDLPGQFTLRSASADDYFREMLLTYRLIFGHDTASHRLFAYETTPSSHQTGPYLRPRADWIKPAALDRKSKAKTNRNILQLPDADPLLPLLCSNPPLDPRITAFYDELSEPYTPETYYMPHTFPFFAKKILILQGYVREQNPRDWRALWHDHRNNSNWWQFWAVLFIGGGTILLSVLSLFFQIWQCALSLAQLKQGAGGGPVTAAPNAARMMIRDDVDPRLVGMAMVSAGEEVTEVVERVLGVTFLFLMAVTIMRRNLILRFLVRASGVRYRERRRVGRKKMRRE